MADERVDNSIQKRRVSVVGAIVGIVILAVFVGLAVYLKSASFNALVRSKVVATLEDLTGGRVELKSLRWNISKLDVEIDDLTIHGTEGPSEVPYAHLDHLTIHAKIIALLQKEIGLRYLAATHPVIHLIVYPDGRTNQPTPKAKSKGGDPILEVFDLAIDDAVLSDGLLIYNDRKVPFNVAANKLAAGLKFRPNADLNRREYDLSLKIGDLSTDLKGGTPLVSNAETEIALHPTDADIKVLRWSSPRSRMEASGKIVNLQDPFITLDYNATFNAVEAARLMKMPALRSGEAGIKGSGALHGSEYSAHGRLDVRDFGYRQGTTNIAGLNASTDYAIDPKDVTLSDLRAALLGGTARGSVKVADWQDAKKQKGSAQLALAGFNVERLMSVVDSPALKKVRVNSTASGDVKASWVGSPSNARAEVALDFKAAGGDRTAIPLTGPLRATYDGAREALSISQLDLHSRATELTALGAIGLKNSADAALRFTLQTHDLSEFDSTLAAMSVQKPPVRLNGNARLDGTATGSLADPHVRGHLQVVNFDVDLPQGAAPQAGVQNTAASTAAAPARSVHWDSLTADFDYSPDAAAVHNGQLRRGSAAIAFDANASLRHAIGRKMVAYPTKQMPFHARVQVANASVQDVETLAGYNYPVTGTLNLSADVSGTMSALAGSGRVTVDKGSAYGEPFRTLQADLKFSGNDAQLTRLFFAQNGGTVQGRGAYNIATKAFTADLQGRGFELSHIKQLQKPNQQLSGGAQFNLQASGTVEAPAVNGHVQVSGLTLNNQALGNVVVDAHTAGDMLTINGGVANAITKLTLDGHVRLRGDFPGDVRLAFTDFNIDPLLKVYMPGKVQGNSRINGVVTATGPLKQPKLLAVEGDIPQMHVAIENYALDNSGPIRFAMRDQVLQIQQLHVVGQGTDFTASGTAALAGDKALNARANGNLNLSILQSFNPDISSSGTTVLAVEAGGTTEKPDLRGQIDLQNANVAMIDVPNGLSNMNGRMVFNQNRLVVQKLTAQTGGGQINIGGFATYQNGLLFDLNATGRNVRVRTSGVSVVADADLRFAGSLRGATLSGDVTVTKFSMSQSFDLGTAIAKSKEPPSTPDPTSIANRVRLNVRVTSSPQLAVVTSLATLSGDVDLTARGTPLNPIILGRIDVSEGDILFQGTKYHLERGDITFTNPTRIDPVLNVEASASIRDYDITLGFHGPLDHLSTTYRSEPPLATADIISLLAFQRTTEEAANAPSQTSFTETAQNAVLGEALNAAVSSRIQKLFGISKVKIDPQGGGLENNKPSITVEQSVNKRLTLTFVTYPTQSNQQLIQVEYNVNKNVSILGVRDQYGVLGIDVRLRQRKR